MPLEELNGALVLFRSFPRFECAKVAAPSGLGVFLPRIKAIFAGYKFANHIFIIAQL